MVYIAGTNSTYTSHEFTEGMTVRELLEGNDQPTEGINILVNENTALSLDQQLEDEDIVVLSVKTGGNL